MSSYVLDRDLLLNSVGGGGSSARVAQSTTHHWIDVNSNSALVGSSSYQRSSDAEFKKQMADMQDQLRMLKTDVEKKDRLISELSSFREVERIRATDATKLDAIFSVEKSTVELTKRELTTTIGKLEHVSNELSEVKAKLTVKDEKIHEIKREMDLLKSENSNMNSMIVAQRNRIKELESELGGFETVASKSGITITTLQKDNKDLQQHILELESRIRTHVMEREEAERKTESLYNKLSELTSKVTTITGVTISSNITGLDLLIAKINEIMNENSMVKGKLLTTAENSSKIDAENKANRETIQRLVNELNKLEKDSTNNKLSFENLKAERDSALTAKSILEKEIETLKERTNSIQTAWQSTKIELEKREAILNGHSANQKQIEYESLYNKNCLLAFKEQVATLLSDGFVKVDANEDQIKEKIQLLMTSSKDRGLMIASMESKIQQLASQLSEQTNTYKEMEAKYHRGEARVIELESKLKNLDSEYCATEVMRENLRNDHLKYLSFLERIGKILKINDISADFGMDMNIDVIIARAEQLIKMESESIQDKQTNIYNLQRKIKQLKEQLDNKELHLDLLRKKLSSLEEERAGKCALEKEVDDHVMMSKKFKVKVEKLTEQLNVIKSENENLKCQLFDYNGAKSKISSYECEISRLVARINELESVKDKQSVKLAKLKDDIESVNVEVSKTRCSSDTAVHSLSHELRVLKQDLERYQERERQLLDFRNVIARMLGLDANSLAVADYEIISRIERIISSFNETVVPVHIQPLAVQPLHVQQVNARIPVSTSYSTTQELYSTSSSSNSSSHMHASSSSPSRREFHVHSHSASGGCGSGARSPSPHRNYHYQEVQTKTRSRSKSPRKVTIDPNSY